MSDELERIREEFMRFAPAYAEDEAEAALQKIVQLQSEGLARSGLYYLVLVDIVGSTDYIAEYGNDAAAARIEVFVTASIDAISNVRLTNTAIFLKEIGDAVLLIFQCFPDILRWQAQLEAELLDGLPTEEPSLVVRTCVHVGDVILRGVNPIALGVSQLFKFEKEVKGGDIALSATAYNSAWPTLARAYHAFEPQGSVELDGYPEPMTLYRLKREGTDGLRDLLQEKTVLPPEDEDPPG